MNGESENACFLHLVILIFISVYLHAFLRKNDFDRRTYIQTINKVDNPNKKVPLLPILVLDSKNNKNIRMQTFRLSYNNSFVPAIHN